MSDLMLARSLDEHNDFLDRAERIFDRDEWLPKDLDEADNLINGIQSYMGANFWQTLSQMTSGDQLARTRAIQALAVAAERAIRDRCYDMAGDA